MRKALYLAAALLVCSAMVFAQESGSTSSPSQSGAQSSTQSGTSGASTQTGTTTDQNNSMSGQATQGCLMGSNGNYTLTDATGATYQLQGDDSELSSNVNKQVEVMGTPGTSASASTSEPGSTSGNASAGNANAGSEAGSTGSQGGSTAQASASKTLNVTSVHKIADNCGGGAESPK